MPETLKKLKLPKFIMDAASLLSSKIFVIFIELLISILIARLLGPIGKGIIAAALVIPTLVLSFADLGLRQSITYFMGKKIYTNQQILSTMSFSIIFTTLLGILFALFSYLLSGFHERYGFTVVLVPLVMIPAHIAVSYSNGVLMAKRQISKISLVNILPVILCLLSVLFFMILNVMKVEFVLLGKVMASVITASYVLFLVRKFGNLKPVFYSEVFKNMLKKGITYALALFVISLNYSVDVVILERLTNSAEVGIYTIGVSVANMLWIIPNAIHMVNSSYSANTTDSLNYARKTSYLLKIVLYLSLLPLIFLYLLAPYVIPWIYGYEFIKSGIVVQAILPGVWAMLIFKILNSDLAGRGRPEAAMWVYLLAAGVNIVLNNMWCPSHGATGAAWASTVSYTVGAGLFGIVYSRMSNLTLVELFIPKKHDIQMFVSHINVMVKPKRTLTN
jgi:O-antigen/teichoic acid export membrane protein